MKWCDNLTIIQNVLDSWVDVGEAIQSHCSELRQTEPKLGQQDAEMLIRVRLDLQRVRSFRRTADCLMKQTEGTSQLVIFSMM